MSAIHSSLSIWVWTSTTVMRVSFAAAGLSSAGRLEAGENRPGPRPCQPDWPLLAAGSVPLGAGKARRRRIARRGGRRDLAGGRRGGARPRLHQRLPVRPRLAVPAMADLAFEGVGIGADRLVGDRIVVPEQRKLPDEGDVGIGDRIGRHVAQPDELVALVLR